MSLPFLDKEAEQELVHRIERARETEEKRFRERKAAIMEDYRNRGMLKSGMYVCAVSDEGINHIRIVASIARDELFAIVEAQGIRLNDADVKSISKYLTDIFNRNADFLKQDLEGMTAQTGLLMRNDQAFRMQIQQAIHREAIVEVSVRATVLRRELGKELRKWWSERVEKLLWLVVGVAVGILGTLGTTQWLAK